MTAPDGGWGWACVFGCLLMHFLQGGFMRSYGVIYVYLRENFGASATVAAWIGGFYVAVQHSGCKIY